VSDDQCCEFCLVGSGPLQERSYPYGGHEGRNVAATAWEPYVQAIALEDGWVALWEHLADDPILVCPFHANGHAVPRAPATATVADVTIDRQEFDYVGQRGDVAMFKHVKTRRYFGVILTSARSDPQRSPWSTATCASSIVRSRRPFNGRGARNEDAHLARRLLNAVSCDRMKPEYNLDEPWNLPPVPTWCGNVFMSWAQKTPAQRKAAWFWQPKWWHDTVGRDRIEYWRSRL